MCIKLRSALVLISILMCTAVSYADWVETNQDGVVGGGLDYAAHWVAAWNGQSPVPATDWYTDSYLSTWYGTDPGWTGNVVNITDADATAYVAQNRVESFTDVKATVSVSTTDTYEEFGAMIRADYFDHADPISSVTCYAATFSANGALGQSDPMKFTLYKIVNGVVVYSDARYPFVPAGFDDYIVTIELKAVGDQLTAKLFDDADSPTPVQTITWQDSSPLSSGYTGVINQSTGGISAYYDTLSSVVIPEPATVLLLASGGALLYRRRTP